jgi:hypothetical protein
LAQARRIFDPCATVLDTCLVPKRLLPQHCSEEAVEGRFELAELGKITCPMLNVYAKKDHIVPPVTSQALGGKVGSSDYAELGLPGGHVGVFVGGKRRLCLDRVSPIG